MPVPTELAPFFKNLVDKSKKSEINWEAAHQPDSYVVRFPDFSIQISQDGTKPYVAIQLHNDEGAMVTDFKVNSQDAEWIGAVSLINSADRKVRKAGRTLQRAMEELGKTGVIGLGAEAR